MAPALLYTSANGIKGTGPALMRFTETASDGADGYCAEQDLNYESAKPYITEGGEFVRAVFSAVLAANPNSVKKRRLYNVLDATDGGAIDPFSDKIAQLADQTGNVMNGDLPALYLATNAARIALIDGAVRPTYNSLGIPTKATPLSQK